MLLHWTTTDPLHSRAPGGKAQEGDRHLRSLYSSTSGLDQLSWPSGALSSPQVGWSQLVGPHLYQYPSWG